MAGIELARRMGQPARQLRHPTMLADAAKALAKQPRVQCKVHGPAEVAAGHGRFHGGCPRHRATPALH